MPPPVLLQPYMQQHQIHEFGLHKVYRGRDAHSPCWFRQHPVHRARHRNRVLSFSFRVPVNTGITPDEVPNLLKVCRFTTGAVFSGKRFHRWVGMDKRRRNFGGSGLGLSITNNLLQSMGSNGLQIESDLGKGFKAWFDLHLEIVEDRANCLSHAKVARDILPGLPPITVVPEESIGEASHASTDGQNVSPAPSSPSLLDHVAPEAGDVPAPVAPFPASQVPAAPELPFDQSAPLTTGQACVPSMSPPGRSPAGSPSPRAARRPPESPPAHFSPGSAAKPVGRPVRVLLVEDNAMTIRSSTYTRIISTPSAL
ncbi:MAG: hypothetical protein BJ554DRAFT_2554, partial [Olpidium bornovanus]